MGQRFCPYKDTPLSPNGRCLHGSLTYTVDCMLYGELEHAHCHVQPEKMEEKLEKMEKSVKTKLLLHLSFPDK